MAFSNRESNATTTANRQHDAVSHSEQSMTNFHKFLAIVSWWSLIFAFFVPFFKDAPKLLRRHALWVWISVLVLASVAFTTAFIDGLAALPLGAGFADRIVTALLSVSDVTAGRFDETYGVLAFINTIAILMNYGPYFTKNTVTISQGLLRFFGVVAVVFGFSVFVVWAISLIVVAGPENAALDNAQMIATLLGFFASFAGIFVLTQSVKKAIGGSFLSMGTAIVLAGLVSDNPVAPDAMVGTVVIGLIVLVIGAGIFFFPRLRRGAAH